MSSEFFTSSLNHLNKHKIAYISVGISLIIATLLIASIILCKKKNNEIIKPTNPNNTRSIESSSTTNSRNNTIQEKAKKQLTIIDITQQSSIPIITFIKNMYGGPNFSKEVYSFSMRTEKCQEREQFHYTVISSTDGSELRDANGLPIQADIRPFKSSDYKAIELMYNEYVKSTINSNINLAELENLIRENYWKTHATRQHKCTKNDIAIHSITNITKTDDNIAQYTIEFTKSGQRYISTEYLWVRAQIIDKKIELNSTSSENNLLTLASQ